MVRSVRSRIILAQAIGWLGVACGIGLAATASAAFLLVPVILVVVCFSYALTLRCPECGEPVIMSMRPWTPTIVDSCEKRGRSFKL